jgi:23S rRNA (guanine2445-N2)-methyltransferase / 23S rRNA (guanine2069-N7)-methyltransferase
LNNHNFFATSPLGLELLLADELRGLGAEDVKDGRAGVSFSAELETAYRVCLWSRLANRILLKLGNFQAESPEQLYEGISDIDWAIMMLPDASLAVDFASSRSRITHTQYGAQKVKDAIVDQFRELCGIRPSVRLDRPDIRVNVYLDKDIASVSLDLSGESLHKRGYRLEGGIAPLKENLAAAVLLRAGWPQIAKAGGELVDPMCGSGTLLVEAAWMAADIAPGLMRDYYGFQGWKHHRPDIWESLLQDAHNRREIGLASLPTITGYDLDRWAVHAAIDNIDRAGLQGLIHVEKQEAKFARPHSANGLLVVNPPYGERLGDEESLVGLYTELGGLLRQHFPGWKASVLTGNPEMAFKLGIRARKFYKLYNGAIECKLFNFEIDPERYFTPHEDESGLSEETRKAKQLMRHAQKLTKKEEIGPGAEMFANRLRKNLKNLGKWARQQGISCYRLYDADLPEYAVAVDVYQSDQTWLHVQEYEAPSTIDLVKAEHRLTEALSVMPQVLEIPPEQLILKIRRKQKGTAQYEKLADAARFHQVEEGGCRFWVNFEDYLDTGLFLDHRPTRLMIQSMAKDKHFLNLFAYTGTATVHAALGGASSTTSVDMSNTYIDWARQNLELNGIKGYHHELIQADCLAWLDAQLDKRGNLFDLIFLDPPTFSNSKRMGSAFDIQRDHVDMLHKTARLLTPNGQLIFSTNFRKFKLDGDALQGLAVEDISTKTIPKDFERNPRIHYCWIINKTAY